MAAAIPIIGLAAGAVSAVGQVVGGVQARHAAERNAAAAREEAGLRADQYNLAAARTMGTAKAQVGASGVTMEGSPLQVQAESMRQAEQNAYIIMRGGQLEAQNQIRAGKAAELGGYFGGAGTALKTAYDHWNLG